MDIQKELERIGRLAVNIYDAVNEMLDYEQREERRFMHIEEVGFSSMVKNNLRRHEIFYVEHIAKMQKRELVRLRGMGRKSIKEIISKVRALGFDNKSW